MRHQHTIGKIVFWGALTLFPMTVLSQTFKSNHLQMAYEKLQLKSSPEQAKALAIRHDESGTIEHIGMPLFNEEMRTLLPSPIYDYLEFAALEHKYHLADKTLQQQRVKFHQGTWEDLEQIKPEDDCAIDNLNDQWYIVKWSRQDKELISVAVPIDYELLANSSRKEMEQDFCRSLKQFTPQKQKPEIIETDDLESLHRDGLLIKKGDSFLLPEITNDTFYRLSVQKEQVDTIIYEEEVPTLLLDAAHPQETLANILLTDISPRTTLMLELLLAGYHKESIQVSAQQWKQFCQSQGCSPYYIYENADEVNAKAILLMYNRSEGYAHMAYLNCPLDDLGNEAPAFSGKVYMYIPTSNIKTLFEKVPEGKSSTKAYGS